LIVPDPNYRPNPDRAIYVQGPIDEQLIYRLTPQVVALQSEERTPITVYIDSPGGNINSTRSLWSLLTASNQDYAQPCRIITVATSRAASAAADLLCSGDYAIALPQSTILYHGTRTAWGRDLPLTYETTSTIAQFLRFENERYAAELMRKNEFRFMFRFLLSKPDFESIRSGTARQMSDAECFLAIVSDRLSDQAKKLLKMARERQGRYETLLNIVQSARKYKNVVKTEASQIKEMVDFEVKNARRDRGWTFGTGGLARLNDDFFLLKEHLEGVDSERLNRLCMNWGVFALEPSQQTEINDLPEPQKNERLIQIVRPSLEPMWSFFVALCHVLQERDYQLTATDSFWLGLTDEVMGAKDLRCFRTIMEYQPDSEKPSPQSNRPAKKK
jgi:ATP-dependent protease ClpP protease subunit